MGTLRIPLRTAGAAMAWSGIAWAVATPFHPSIFRGDVAGAVLRTTSWQAIHVLVMTGAIAAILGIAGLITVHGGQFSAFSSVLFWGTTVGAVVTAAIMFAEATVFPVVATDAPHLLELDGALLGSPGVRLAAVVAGLYPVGLVMTGLLASRCDVAPAAGRWLAVSTTAFIVLGGPFVPVLGVLSTTAAGMVHLWWGVILWRCGSTRGQRGRSASTSGTSG